jgi:O-antigen biosynthesis protein
LSSQPRVSVVICAYTQDRWDDLADALASVRAQTCPAFEIVVAIDHAPDLAGRVRDTYADVRVVENDAVKGLSGARNTGIAAATGDVVAFLDDDATAAPDWLERLCRPYADPAVVAVGGRVVPRWDTERPVWFPPEFDWVVGCTYVGHPPAGAVRNVIGANMSFRRSVFAQVGGFDDRVGRIASLPAGCEETELCIRVRQRLPGAVVWYEPDALVSHRVRPERTTFSYFQARCRAEGMSKTRVAHLVGHRDGLETERGYVSRTLPLGALRDTKAGLTGGGAGMFGRVGARVAGVALTGAGFTKARLQMRREAAKPRPFVPALVTHADLDLPGGLLATREEGGRPYERAVVLVREDGRPRAIVELDLPDGGLDAAAYEELLRGAVAGMPPAPARDDDAPALFSVESVFTTPPPVTVVIATRDRPETLRRCIDSVLACDYPSFDIVVVDNAPASIATYRVVRDLYDAGQPVRYVRETTPGLACAHNRALQETTAPIVAFTDDDVVVDRGWLANLVAGFGVAPDVACVTGMIFPLELETPAQDLVERTVGFNKGFERRLYRLGSEPGDLLFPYAAGRFGSGANMAFRTDVLLELGGFDPALGTGTRARGGDDLAAFFDVVASGHALVYEPAAIVSHPHRRDDEGLRRQALGYGAGLTAYLTKTLVDRPGRALDLARRAPAGLRYALGRGPRRHGGLPSGYPQGLVRRERLGMAIGPALYGWSRYVTRNTLRPSRPTGTNDSSVVSASGDQGLS